MKGFVALKSVKEFSYHYKVAKAYHTKFFVVFYLKDNRQRLSVVASKKVGNAVKRNFAKRRLRAIFIDSDIKKGSFVLVAKKDIVTTEYKNLQYLFTKSLKALK